MAKNKKKKTKKNNPLYEMGGYQPYSFGSNSNAATSNPNLIDEEAMGPSNIDKWEAGRDQFAQNAGMIPGIGGFIQAGHALGKMGERAVGAIGGGGERSQQVGKAIFDPIGGLVNMRQNRRHGGHVQQYPLGGQLPYTGDPRGLVEFNGPSHEDGGFMYADAELEKNETVDPNNNFVFSDTLKVEKGGKTFAEQSKKFKIEDNDDQISKNTKQLMLNKLRETQEFMKQEGMQKGLEKLQKKYGGHVGTTYGAPVEGYGAQPNTEYGARPYYRQGGQMYQQGGEMQNPIGTPHGQLGQYGYGQGSPNSPEQYTGQPDLSPSGVGTRMAPGELQARGYGYDANDFNYGANGQPKSGAGGFGGPEAGGMTDMNPQGAVGNYYGQPGVGDAQGGSGGRGGDFLYNAGKYGPTAFNLFKGLQKPESYDPVYNPEYNKAIGLMENRTYDIEPQLAANKRGFTAGRRSAENLNNPGQFMSGVIGSQLAKQRGDAQAYATKNNAENRYKAEEARLRAGLGEGKAGEDRFAQMDKMRAKATRDQFLSKGLEGVSEGVQRSRREKNMTETDKQRLAILEELYGSYGNYKKLTKQNR